MLTMCRSAFGFSVKNRGTPAKLMSITTDFCTILKREIGQFYVRDDVSCMTAGKKEMHPFWVLLPDLKLRDTCLCKLHENLSLMAEMLFKMHLVPSANMEHLVEKCCCSATSKTYMYGSYCACKEDMHISIPSDVDLTQPLAYKQWMLTTELKEKDGETVFVKLTSKENVHEPLNNFMVRFSDMMKFKKHFFNMNHQYLQYRYLKGSLCDDECMIHINFSENFTCKYFKEIQSVHFGSSHCQATLHTGVFYVRTETELKPTSFCTISNSKQRDPCGIWTYLDPVLKQNYPQVTKVHFFSDGPTTQYKQKLNFYFFCTKIQSYGFTSGTWNFSKSGHGKGAADGV